ncbi:membrane protein [Actibacterium mucosum KCTC 23349]|uniref:Membrane protein n=1 Tax=Actibacterium mucosum KCTC 23349 TaxID=1454373 RepID=A0A037ZJ85_9RHOB|nr:anthrone oxygenase family protein [Actibacterium mucosum]KAJ56173.1 membrane protein [Actibacterium mucosum KCTC 23349]
MRLIALSTGIVAVLFAGAIFGFFYAWICSTMWGLDAADPRIAIEAMQAMNASVRNATFAPAFFGTPFVLFLAGYCAFRVGARAAVLAFVAGGAVCAFGGVILTMSVNVPMNEALALVDIPSDRDAAADIWDAYSQPWQVWNITRTIASGVALALAATGVAALGRA